MFEKTVEIVETTVETTEQQTVELSLEEMDLVGGGDIAVLFG